MRTVPATARSGAAGTGSIPSRPGLIESRCAQLGIDYRKHQPARSAQRRRALERMFSA